ncbi:MAG: nitrogenase component 1 [Lachnospiraceae bacterium]|nr:nitrogenase component 1 [Lachnospiraceae bacterium]
MGLCRYLPTPSDRMGVIWTLLSAKGAVVLEYGPAGTTHFSVSMYGQMGVEPNQSLFTTHLSEDDIIMGDVTRLEEAIREIDEGYHPEVIFVVSSSVTSIIGADIKGVCTYMEQEINARLIAVDTGGFKGDYSLGMREGYNLLTKTFATDQVEKKKASYNVLGASGCDYRMRSDLWELRTLMQEGFSYTENAILGMDSSVTALTELGAAEVNLVLREEALEAAKYLEKTYGTPYVYGAPYGYEGTACWLMKVSDTIGKSVNPELSAKLRMRKMNAAGYKMYASMYAHKENRPQSVLVGDVNRIQGFSKIMEEVCIPVTLKISNHSLAGFEAEDIVKPAKEKEKIDLLKEKKYSLVLGDDISLYLCDESCEKVVTSFPLIRSKQIAEHMPLMGIRGMDYLLEAVDRYYGRL